VTTDTAAEASRRPVRHTGGHAARAMAVAAVNIALGVTVFILGSLKGGKLPALDTRTLGIGVMPVSAAMALMLSCRRIDFALPMILAFALAFQTKRLIVVGEPYVSLLTTVGIAAALGLASALVTWYGRISSALWTGILGFSLWMVLAVLKIPDPGPGPWPWPAALALTLALVAGGAALLGTVGFVNPPNLPPIMHAGGRGLTGLILAWVLASITCALASLSDAARLPADRLQAAYPLALSAAVLSGAFIQRGRWGAMTAIALACLGHLVWAFTYETHLANETADVLLPAAAPLAAIPLYLGIDWLIRRSTGETAPTGLLG